MRGRVRLQLWEVLHERISKTGAHLMPLRASEVDAGSHCSSASDIWALLVLKIFASLICEMASHCWFNLFSPNY